MGNHGGHGPTTWSCKRSGSIISSNCKSGIAGMGMVMAYYGKVFMRQLDEKVQLLDEKLKAISERASDLSHSASNIERRMDEGSGQARDRLRHSLPRLVDLRGWVLRRRGDEPCPMHMTKAKMRDWLLIEYDATRAGSHQGHEIMWVGICTLAYISVFEMMVDSEVERHELFSRNDEGRTKLK